MCKKMKQSLILCVLLGLIASMCGPAQANWSETFNGNAFDLATWQFECVPDMTGTYTGTIQDGPDDNDYLALAESSSLAVGGSAFGGAYGSNEEFTDVRIGAVVNVVGDACRNNYALIGRTDYIIDPDGSQKGYPGMWANCYALIVYWDEGPANVTIEVQKVIDNDTSDVMNQDYGAVVPGLNNARSYYAELDIVGSDPVYVTGSLYEYKGGPLVARVPTLVDTNARDPWEEEREINYPVFARGVSGICGYNEDEEPAGYYTTFDDVFSISDGPAAVNPAPADGATDVSINADLSWVEAAFATSRELWFGKKGAMQKVDPNPAGTTFDPGALGFGQTYEWRVDEIGPAGTVTGHTWSFTTRAYLIVDDIEDYTDNKPDRVFDTWLDGYTVAENGSIVGYYPEAPFVETEIVHSGAASMPFTYNNADTVNYAETVADTADLKAGQDWTRDGVKALTLHFRGRIENTEEIMYVRLEDAAGKTHTVTNPYPHAVQSESWLAWDIDLGQFSAEGLDLSNVKKICIGFGDKTGAVTCDGSGIVFFDDIRLYPARCFNAAQLDLRGDVNGDCAVDFRDLAVMASNWLNDGLSVTP